MRKIRYHCYGIVTGTEQGWLTTAPGAEGWTWEIGWHLYDHDTRNPRCNWDEVNRILKQSSIGETA